MQEYVYHMTLKTHFYLGFSHQNNQNFAIRKRDIFMDINA